MVTTAQVAQRLERISYKPGWTFEVYDGEWEGRHLTISCEVPDAFAAGRTTTLRVECFLHPMGSLEAFERWLAWRLARIEVHEMREFLKRDGEVIFPPHAEFAERDLS